MERRFYAKLHTTGGYTILAVCDKDLLGKKIIDTKRKLVVYVDPRFYGGEEITESQLLRLIEEVDVVNALGRDTVNVILSRYPQYREAIILIGDVPHIQILRLE
ncbi:MAG: hypothetical protein DRJ40_00025 [Thermoprotei archaeon]|nr:MAG: hypothetical protein DRJ40_00025 [Thermoprotei archaeon]